MVRPLVTMTRLGPGRCRDGFATRSRRRRGHTRYPHSRQPDLMRAMEQPTAQDALRQLEPLVGDWTLEARFPDGQPWPGGGRATFEWHESRAHLVPRVTVEL